LLDIISKVFRNFILIPIFKNFSYRIFQADYNDMISVVIFIRVNLPTLLLFILDKF